MANTKQIKITKLFRKAAMKLPEESDELQEEVKSLEQKLKEKHNELFQIQRNKYKRKFTPTKSKPDGFVRPQKIMLQNSIENMKRELELMSMLSGMEVQSYAAEDQCCIMYHLQHDAENQVSHGLWIDMKSGSNEVIKCSFPLGFNYKAVIAEFDNVMSPTCLSSIRKALVAYYDRLEQFTALQKLLCVDAKLFKKLDSSHVEISFYAENRMETKDELINIVLALEYRIYDIRPKTYNFNDDDLSEDVIDVIKNQCTVFRKVSLQKAFKEAFMDDIGPYRLMRQLKADNPNVQRKEKRFRPNKHNYNNDDTFQPEDCSDQGEDDEIHF